MMSSALFFDLLLIHSLCDISEEEKADKISENFMRHVLKFKIVN